MTKLWRMPVAGESCAHGDLEPVIADGARRQADVLQSPERGTLYGKLRPARRCTVRVIAWAGLFAISISASLALDAGVTQGFSHNEPSYEYGAMLLNSVNHQDDSQLHEPPLNQVCWPIEAGVDAQCVESP